MQASIDKELVKGYITQGPIQFSENKEQLEIC